MAPNEIQALVAGATAGAVAVSTGHAWWAGRAANRAATEAETALKQTLGEHWLNDFRLYRLKQRAEEHRPTNVYASAEAGIPPGCSVCGPMRWPCPTVNAAYEETP
ncbi:hypothetical protein TPA0906_34540 [Streptomyces olivaceus]|uniref:hypothetical protein n=1 Tax=Streptomyces olivaceus TaxID=47716 RepID=UPI0022ED553B|nr:hypothetical protein [Streptomyces olivaceus]GHJ01589.1 hypothetical protein TPA0906_34540 [Streptomyces olivaceus]